jgi:hypothetical protein
MDMQDKASQIKRVIKISIMVGLAVIIVGFIALQIQERRSRTGQAGGGFPTLVDKGGWQFYNSDKEGDHYYRMEKMEKPSPGIVRAWDKLIYSKEGKELYLSKRARSGMFTEGLGELTHRSVLYELNCFSERGEYHVVEMFERSKEGTTLDYAKSGSYKDWTHAPEGSFLETLMKTVCPAKG